MGARNWLLGGSLLTFALAAASEPGSRYEARITRTSYGIPHVLAPHEAGLAYGVGYAYAQDNACVFLEEMLTVRGERALHFNADAIGGPDVESGSISSPNLHSDFFFRLLNEPAAVERALRQQTPEVRVMLEGYAAGFNRSVRERLDAGSLPQACREAPWVREITAEDLIRLMRRYAAEASVRFLDALVRAAPPASSGAQPAAASLPPPSPPALGSNAVAIGAERSANRRGMLLANPHFPWHGSLRFYQMHLTVPGELDVMGASLAGLPFVSIGFTRDFAWTHTVNTSSHYTLHALELAEGEPTHYVVDGKTRKLRRQTVSAQIADPSGKPRTVTHDFWISDYGPVIVWPGKFDWTRRTAYALQDANLANARLFEVSRAMNRSRTLAELEASLERVLGLPWVNTIAADRHGTAWYANLSVIPNVPDAQIERCVPRAFRGLINGKFDTFVLDGSRSECNWQQDAAAVQPGTVPAQHLPRLARRDFVQNSNDSAWLTNPASPLTGFPAIVSASGYEQNGRTRFGITHLQAHEGRVAVAGLERAVLDNRSYHAPMLRRSLPAVCDEKAAADLASACAALRRWDGAARLGSIGYALAQAWLRELKKDASLRAVPFEASDALHTPRDIAVERPESLAAARAALARAAAMLGTEGVRLDAPWGEVQVAVDGTDFIPIHGGDADDVYNVIDGKYTAGRKHVRTGTSYLAVVSFERSGPVAEAVLTYSQSSEPASPHHADQTRLFSAGEWVRLPFTAKEVAADAIGEPLRIEE